MITQKDSVYYYEYKADKCIFLFCQTPEDIRIVRLLKPQAWHYDGLKEIKKSTFYFAYKLIQKQLLKPIYEESND